MPIDPNQVPRRFQDNRKQHLFRNCFSLKTQTGLIAQAVFSRRAVNPHDQKTQLIQSHANVCLTCKRVRRSRFGAACAQAQGVTKAIVGFKPLLCENSPHSYRIPAFLINIIPHTCGSFHERYQEKPLYVIEPFQNMLGPRNLAHVLSIRGLPKQVSNRFPSYQQQGKISVFFQRQIPEATTSQEQARYTA